MLLSVREGSQMLAGDLGKRLLGEVEEVGIGDVSFTTI